MFIDFWALLFYYNYYYYFVVVGGAFVPLKFTGNVHSLIEQVGLLGELCFLIFVRPSELWGVQASVGCQLVCIIYIYLM